ncbi:MAG: hypothetical protein ABI373_01420, partial [Flavobacteriales bacterium]
MRVPILRLRRVVLALLLTLPIAGLLGQCTNTTQYPSNTTVPDPLGASTQISTCSFQQEYSAVGPAVAGGSYEFTCTGGSYITVHEGSAAGTVIGSGYSPLTVTATAADILYAHWTVDSLCTHASGCQTTAVQFLLDCTPPTATVSTVDDCDNNQFSLTVDVTNLGDGTSVDIIHSVNGGVNDTLFDQPVGTYNLGPFTVGQSVDVTVAHSSNYLCNLHFNGQQAGLCPTLVTCGDTALSYTYCYGDNDVHEWHWQNTTPGTPLAIVFSAGYVDYNYGNYGDQFTIYDGANSSAPILFQMPYGNFADLSGLQVTSSGTDLYMEVISDGYGSCQSYGYQSWAWTVGCYDCTPPAATYSVVTDCDAQTFNVMANLTSLGSQSTVQLTNSINSNIVTASATGTYTVGPFPILSLVTVTVQNDTNSLCNIHSPVLTNPLCASQIVCGGAPDSLTYCYTNSDSHTWHWQSSTGSALSILFSAGAIESATFDHLRIYNGPDNTSPLLFEHTSTQQEILTGYQFTASSGDIYMEMTSDPSVSCSTGSEAEWVWQVGCLDCTPPQATFTVNTDCV